MLADLSLLLRQLVHSIVSHETGLRIVAEVTDPSELVATAKQARAHVVIVGDEKHFNEAWHDALATVPRLRVLSVVQDGRRGWLHELRPSSTPLGSLSAASLVSSVRSART